MAAATIRLGKISSINYTAGKARVVYEDTVIGGLGVCVSRIPPVEQNRILIA